LAASVLACGDVEITFPEMHWPGWRSWRDMGGRVEVEFEWRGHLAQGRQIEIKGVLGNIRAVAAIGADVVVSATGIGPPDEVDAVTIDVRLHDNGVTICAVYPDVPGRPANTCEPGDDGNMSVDGGVNDRVEVSFVVEVPAGVTFVGRTMTGDVVARELESDAYLRTLTGDVEVSTAGMAEARTLWGSVVASIGLPDWGRDLEFSAMNGDVDVTIPATTNAEVHATTQFGRIDSEFSLRRVLPGDLRGTIGSGGPTLHLSTMSGDIILRSGSQASTLGAGGE